mgnify:CR=1 FL=1
MVFVNGTFQLKAFFLSPLNPLVYIFNKAFNKSNDELKQHYARTKLLLVHCFLQFACQLLQTISTKVKQMVVC